MKSLGLVLTICFYINIATAGAQEVTYEAMAGNWEYKSPRKKDKTTYNFALERNFVCTTERKEKELVTKGDFLIEKKNENDRLKLNSIAEATKTQTAYYFVKFMGPDTLKAQMVSDKQTAWSDENRRNTMVFIRKKDKPKEKE